MVHAVLRTSALAVEWYLHEVVFPATMHVQPLQLSASGHDLGANLLFKSCLGFSGVPPRHHVQNSIPQRACCVRALSPRRIQTAARSTGLPDGHVRGCGGARRHAL